MGKTTAILLTNHFTSPKVNDPVRFDSSIHSPPATSDCDESMTTNHLDST